MAWPSSAISRLVVRVDGIDERRNEDARSIRSHLVHRQVRLWAPVVQERGQVPVLRLRQHEEVAVDVVTRVLVVEPRHLGAFPRLPDRLAVPVHDEIHAVGVERGDQQQDDVVEDSRGLGAGVGHQLVGEGRRHLRGSELGRMHAAPDRDHRACNAGKPLRLGGARLARVSQPRDCVADGVEPRQVGG
jgi:hypothetical protein